MCLKAYEKKFESSIKLHRSKAPGPRFFLKKAQAKTKTILPSVKRNSLDKKKAAKNRVVKKPLF
jgi:hypothetical protein